MVSTLQNNWSFLKQLIDEGKFESIDWVLAGLLAKECTESQAALICYLSAACRNGHLCVRIDSEGLFPKISEIISDIIDDEANQLEIMIKTGSQELPPHIVQHENLFYFQRFYNYETEIIRDFQRVLEAKPDHEISINQIEELLSSNHTLLIEQKNAIRNVGSRSLSVICGGPGTGKTYTAAQLVKTVWLSIPQEERQMFKIILAAPTGKAASNMEASLSHAVADLEGFCPIEAKTIHALLGIGSKRKKKTKIYADFVIVDECSMIDVGVMAKLLASLKSGTRLVLLGDSHQLPPIEAGSLFSDLVTYLRKIESNALTELKECKRVELKSILEFAETVNLGDEKKALELLSHSQNGLAHFSKTDDLITRVESRFPYRYKNESAQELLTSFQSFRLLTPLRRGLFGVDYLNRLLYQHIENKIPIGDYFVTPILLIKNDYRLNLWNGEVGVLVRKKTDEGLLQKGDFAFFEDRERIPALLLPKFEYAYCLSVHKSQGSEFDEVLLLMPDGSEVFGREVLYTAATRAKKKLTLFGSDEVIEKTIKKVSSRLSGLNLRMSQTC